MKRWEKAFQAEGTTWAKVWSRESCVGEVLGEVVHGWKEELEGEEGKRGQKREERREGGERGGRRVKEEWGQQDGM